jgi:hypothetical protein
MWDGELHVGHRDLKLGKLVIILAGSGRNIARTMTAAKGMQPVSASDDSKLVDVLSRINGGELGIPSLDEVQKDRDRRTDKVCLTISLLQMRFGDRLAVVPWNLLRFVAMSKFRYGVRSIAHLIDLIPLPEEVSDRLGVDDMRLPLRSVEELRDSSLAYHMFSEDGAAAIVNEWKTSLECEALVRFMPEEQEQDVPF